ncbi:MAG: hypothetical protein AAGD00_07190 [Planctomycetota bacterium]
MAVDAGDDSRSGSSMNGRSDARARSAMRIDLVEGDGLSRTRVPRPVPEEADVVGADTMSAFGSFEDDAVVLDTSQFQDFPAPAIPRARKHSAFERGDLGLSRTNEMLLWLAGALVGLSLFIHAMITMWWIYIGLTAVWAPIAFYQFSRAKDRWQGNRSFARAVEETLGGGADSD